MARRGTEILKAYEERIRADKDRQHLTQTCFFCGATWQGPLGEVRERALTHRQQEHPEVVQQRQRRKLGSPRTVGARSLDENLVLTRAQGGAEWLNDLTPACVPTGKQVTG